MLSANSSAMGSSSTPSQSQLSGQPDEQGKKREIRLMKNRLDIFYIGCGSFHSEFVILYIICCYLCFREAAPGMPS